MEVLKRESLNNLPIEEVQKTMEADMVSFTDEIASHTLEQLKELEDVLMEEFKKNEEYLKAVVYELDKSITFDGSIVDGQDIAKEVVYFLNQLEVDFRATLGIYQAINFWKSIGSESFSIPYAVYDSTVRLLGTLKYKGFQDCKNILVVNNWFTGNHDRYNKDNLYTNYLAGLHNIILSKMDELATPTDGK